MSLTVISDFFNTLKGFVVDDRFLGVWYDLPFLLRVLDSVMYLVADCRGLEIDRTAGILHILQNMRDSRITPAVRILLRGAVCITPL